MRTRGTRASRFASRFLSRAVCKSVFRSTQLTVNSFLMPKGIAKKEDVPRRAQIAIDGENILKQPIRIEPPAGAEIRKGDRSVMSRASIRFLQAKTRQSAAEAVRKEVKIGCEGLHDRQRRDADEGLTPDVRLEAHVR